MGVHGKGVSLAPFKALPFGKVGWAIASEDATMQRAAEGDVPGYMARTVLDLPPTATVFEIAGGRRETSLLTTYWSGSTDVFGGPASRNGSLNSLFQVALYLPS